MRHNLRLFTAISALAFIIAPPVFANELASKQPFEIVANFEKQIVYFEAAKSPKGAHNFSLTVNGPRGYVAVLHDRREIPRIDLQQFGKVVDGTFYYEVTGATEEKVEMNQTLNNGRDSNRNYLLRQVTANGSFVVKDGKILEFEKIKE